MKDSQRKKEIERKRQWKEKEREDRSGRYVKKKAREKEKELYEKVSK